MRKTLAWSLVVMIVVAVGTFGSVLGEWETITMKDEEAGFEISFSAPSNFLVLEDEEIEETFGDLGIGLYIGDMDFPDIGLVIIVTEWAEFFWASIEEWELDEEYFTLLEEVEIEVDGFPGVMITGLDNEDMTWVRYVYVPDLHEAEMGMMGLIIMMLVAEDLVDDALPLAEGLVGSIRF